MNIKQRVSAWLSIAVAGGMGGGMNAWLCYAKIPVPAEAGGTFGKGIVLHGVVHGAILAFVAVWSAVRLWEAPRMIRWLMVPVVGWLGGWLSYIALFFPHELSAKTVLKETILWPFQYADAYQWVWIPYAYFGLVSLVAYVGWNICRQLQARSLMMHVLVGVLSGVLGSSWWWVSFKPWYFSILHGTIWGACVGCGVWQHRAKLCPHPQ